MIEIPSFKKYNHLDMSHPVIALLTDFGTSDVYVGVMKGVILSVAPDVNIVDLSHEVHAHDVRGGAFLLKTAATYFPHDTVFLAVVDPGVGSSRKGLIAKAGPWIIVGPDNGLFTFFWIRYPEAEAYEITSADYRLPSVSDTFHGRDVFAPAAAWASRGIPPFRFGPRIERPVTLTFPTPKRTGDRVEGVVIHVDRFGNLVSNLGQEWLKQEGVDLESGWSIQVGSHQVRSLVRTYSQAASDEPVALWGSSGFLEISVREKNAARILGVDANTPVVAIRSV